MRTVFCHIVLVAAMGASGAAVVDDAKIATARRDIEKQYGGIIKEVQGTESEADDIALAKQFLIVASEGADSPETQLALIQTAIDMVLPLSGDDAVTVLGQGMDAAEGVRPYKPVERAAIEENVATGRLAKAQARRASAAELKPLAASAARAHLAYVSAAAQEAEIPPETDAALTGARMLYTKFKLTDLAEQLRSVETKLRDERLWRMRLGQAEARLKDATDRGDATAITMTSRVVGRLHLAHSGDVAMAGKYFSAAGSDDDRAIMAGASFLADPASVDPESCLAAAESLARQARALEAPGSQSVARCAMAMCRHYQAGEPSVIGGTKARLLMGQLEAILGETETDKLLAAIEKQYGKLFGDVKIIEGREIRVTYDFSDDKQMQDWRVGKATWDIGKGVLACKTAAYDTGRVGSRLRFRMDRPFTVSIQGQADNEVGFQLYVRDKTNDSYVTYLGFALSLDEGIKTYLGTYMPDDRRYKLVKGKVYRFELAYDGVEALVWRINGKVVRSYKKEKLASYFTAGRVFNLALTTEGSDFRLTSYDNISMEGTVVVTTPEDVEAARRAATTKPAGSGTPDAIEKAIEDILKGVPSPTTQPTTQPEKQP